MVRTEFKYEGTAKPSKLKHIDPGEFDMDFKVYIDLDANDSAKSAKIQKEFASEMKDRIDKQMSFLNKRLEEWNDVIDGFVKEGKELEGAFPNTEQDAKKFQTLASKLKPVLDKIESFKKDYQTICENWAENCREQQGLIAIQEAIKSVNKKAVAAKNFRVNLGKAIKVALVIIGVAVSIAAIVVSAGATAPLFIGLASAGLVVATGGNLMNLGKWLNDKGSNETRTYKELQKSLQSIQGMVDGLPSQCEGMAKHVTELQNLVKERATRITELKQEQAKKKAEAFGYIKQVDEIISKAGDSAVKGIAAKKKAQADKVMQECEKLAGQIAQLEKHNTDSQQLLRDLSDYGVEIGKLSGHSGSTLLGNLKTKLTSLDGLGDILSSTGSIVNSASGIHK
jgi:chromosome segregation ATPase